MYRIFGREPAAVAALLAALGTMAVAFGAPVSNEQVGLIGAALSAAAGLFIAWRTAHTTLALVIGAANALLALGVGFGYSLSPEQTAAVLALLQVGFGLINRTQTSPVEVADAQPRIPR